MPVAEFSGERGWGYDGVDLFAPHHAYGGPDGLKRLVDACHGAGLGVVLDVVYNHLGPAGNYLAEFGPYFSDRHQTNWGAAVNFDGPGSDEVRRFVDRQRPHVAAGLPRRRTAPRRRARHRRHVRRAHPRASWPTRSRRWPRRSAGRSCSIAESDRNDPRLVRSRDAGGYGLDAAWADDWHHALHAVLTGERDGYYEDFGSLEHAGQGPPPGMGLRRRLVGVPPARPRPPADRPGRRPIRRRAPRTTTRSATGPRANGSAP